MSARVVQPEVLLASAPMSVAQRVLRLERLTRVLDEAIEIPILGKRIGLDAIIGLVPVAGDVITGLTAAWIVYEAKQLGVSRWTLTRMSWNVVADLVGGAVPLAGDVFDVFFKANRRNVELLKADLRRQSKRAQRRGATPA